MTDDTELPELAEMEAMLDEQDARLHGRDREMLTVALIRLAPVTPFIGLLVLAVLIT
jgi:hypothetical protein